LKIFIFKINIYVNRRKIIKIEKKFYFILFLSLLFLSAAIEERGLTPLLNNLKKLGGWPVLDGERWNEGDFTWKDSVYRFRRLGYSVDYFIDFGVGVDLKNNSRRLIDVSMYN